MSILRVATIEPEGATTTLTLGASGDTVTSSADSIKANTFKDAGGNTIFTSNGSGTLSSVNSALKGGLIFISSETASGSASISFTSGLTSAYKEYVFHFINMNPATDSAFFQFQVSTNGGSSYGVEITSTNFVATHSEAGTNGRIEYVTAGDLAESTSYQPLGLYIGSDTDESFSGELHLFNPSSTTFITNFYGTGNLVSSSIYTRNSYVQGVINSTSAVDAIDFKMSTGNINAGTIAMYGTG